MIPCKPKPFFLLVWLTSGFLMTTKVFSKNHRLSSHCVCRKTFTIKGSLNDFECHFKLCNLKHKCSSISSLFNFYSDHIYSTLYTSILPGFNSVFDHPLLNSCLFPILAVSLDVFFPWCRPIICPFCNSDFISARQDICDLKNNDLAPLLHFTAQQHEDNFRRILDHSSRQNFI